MPYKEPGSGMGRQGAWVTIYLLLVVLAPVALAEDSDSHSGTSETWNQWRGPSRDGRGEMFGPLEKWPEQPAEVWRVEVGTGHSAPVTDGTRVYLFFRSGGDEVAAAYRLTDGVELWSKRYPVKFRARMGGGHHGAGPKSTPVVAGGRLVTLGITGVISSWKAETGERRWQIDFAEQAEKEPFPRWGTSFSPLVQGDRVIVHFGSEDGALLALDAATGQEVWRREGSAPSYASPVLGRLATVDQLVTLTADGLLALSLDGEELWSWEFPMTYMRQNVATPVLIDADTVLTGGEKRPTTAVRAKLVEGEWGVEVLWSRADLPLDMTTAVSAEERICGLSHLKKGQAYCIDTDGETLWLGPPKFAEHASIVKVPGAFLYLLPDASLVVVDGSVAAYRELARYEVAESETWAYPAVIEAGLLIKSHDRLTRFSFADSAP